MSDAERTSRDSGVEPNEPEVPFTEARRETPEFRLEPVAREVASAERAEEAVLVMAAEGGDVEMLWDDLLEGGGVARDGAVVVAM